MNEILELQVPKETVSDEKYKVINIFFKNGSNVKKGEVIATFETSKTTIDIESPIDGYIFYNCQLFDDLPIGIIFAAISDINQIPEDYFSVIKSSENNNSSLRSNTETRFSKAALRIIEENSLDTSIFRGRKIVEKKDVEEYLSKPISIKKHTINKTNNIIIIGGGNHTKICIDILKQTKMYNITGIIYTKFSPKNDILGVPVLGDMNKLENIFEDDARLAVVGIGGLEQQSERNEIYDRLKSIGYHCPNIIHPRSIIEPSAILGEGNHIMAGAIVGSCVTLGNNSIINSNSVVSHDCIIGDNVHIAPGAILAGTVKIGNNTTIGMGATVFYNCNIGSDVIITNGQHIFKNIQGKIIIK